MSDLPDGLSLEIAARQIQSAGAETEVFVGILARNLSSSLGKQVNLRRRGVVKRSIRGITVHASSAQLVLDIDDHGHLHCFRKPVVGGIGLEGEPLELSQWLAALLEATKADAAARIGITNALQQSIL